MSKTVQQSGRDGRVDVTFHGNLALITMRRGQNRLNQQLFDQFNQALDQVLRNPDVKAVATTGEGRFYCNGLDLDWMMNLEETQLERFVKEGLTAVLVRLMTFPLPTICLINGHAFAGGAILAAAHDHVIMQTSKGWWCLNEVHIKLRFSEFLIGMVRTKLPSGQAYHDAVVLGKRFTGDEALKYGIAHEVCEPSQLLSVAQSWVSNTVPTTGYDRDHLASMKQDAYRGVLELAGVSSSANKFLSKM